jgi:pimeloyl-ACP methyl ester carboxylesterase
MSEDATAHAVEDTPNVVTRAVRRGSGIGGSARRRASRSARAILSPHGIRGTALEVAWMGAHLVIYPLGLVRDQARLQGHDRLDVASLPPVQRGLVISDVEAAGTPILLVHGMVDNRSVFTLLRRGLRRRGFGQVIALNYSPFTDDVRQAAIRLAGLVEQVCTETGYERIHVIGHSMGGIVARYYVQRLGGDERVHTLVTLGAPHAGTFHARLVPHPLVRQLRPNSDVIVELAQPAPTCRTRFVAIWSDLDQMVIPKRSATIDHPDLAARNVFVRGVGHMSLPVDGRVVHEICTTLALLDTEGQTLRDGVTAITSTTPRRKRRRT